VLLHESPLAWNLDNYEYPPGALSIEDLGEGNRALRVGQADGSQTGHMTITLRASTHDWNPADPGTTHRVSLRFAASYSGAAFLAVGSPGGGALVDIGGGRLKVWQRGAGRHEVVDLTDAVQQALAGHWQAAELHTYTVEWTSTGQPGGVQCSLRVDDRPLASFPGMERPPEYDPTLEISFECGAGTGLVDWLEWRINDGKRKPPRTFVVEPGVRQLFLDSAGIASREGLTLTVNQPERYSGNPILRGEHPWEKASASVYGTMLFDEQTRQFRLWYLCTPGARADGRKWVEVGGYRRTTGCTLLAYATSTDARQWTKPELHRLSFEGSTANNLLDLGIDNPEGVGILEDPRDPDPARRFKAFFWDRRLAPSDDPTGVTDELAKVPVDPPGLTEAQRAGGMWVAFSPDGIAWTTHGPVLPQGSDTTHSLLFDATRGRYVAYGRLGFGRTVARTESEDALHWSEPKLVLGCDANDGPGGQIYGMPVTLYEGLYLGMFWMYREGTDARIDTQLAVSRDGVRWQRVAGRETFLANGPEGAWDDGMSRVGRLVCTVGDTLYMHYSMVNGPHRSALFPAPQRKFPSAVGLVTLRRDGFVSLDAGEQPGVLLTRPFVLPPGALHVNAALTGGSLRVALCGEDGSPIPGVAESATLSGDRTDAVVDLAPAALEARHGQLVCLRFTLLRSKLFAYWFGE
jgi:hypothetical protein